VTKKFLMRDDGFRCVCCGAWVPPLGCSARDHCPNCLYGLHVDVFPGDRANTCHGLLEPVGVRSGKKTDYQIIYRCQKCHQTVVNQTAADDNLDLIVELTSAITINL
jgi:predicted RNA-binding Zn-ribbon protein involved in translation (DUF1610 family)